MSNNICQQCGMVLKSPIEFHPFAACLMFKVCGDAEMVRKNLQFVADHAPQDHAQAALDACAGIPTEALESGVVAEMVEVLRCIVANAETQPDASKGGLTDIYAVPLDDIETARAIFDAIEGKER